MSLRYEDNERLQASLILDAYVKNLNGMNRESLSIEDQERFDRIQILLKYIKSVKITDSPVLLKVFNMYRCSL